MKKMECCIADDDLMNKLGLQKTIFQISDISQVDEKGTAHFFP